MSDDPKIEVTRQLLTKLRRFLIDLDADTAMAAATSDIGINWTSFAAGGYKEKMLALMEQLRMKPFLYPDFINAISSEIPHKDWQPFGGPPPVIPDVQPLDRRPAGDVDGLSPDTAADFPGDTPDFYNFDLLVTAAGGGSYFVRGSHTVDGGAGSNNIQEFDLTRPEIQNVLKFLSFLAADTADIKQLGQTLFEFLFPLKIYGVFANLYSKARSQGSGVRLRLQIEAPDLHHVPWELIYDPHNDEFLARNPMTPLVRFIERNFQPQSLLAEEKLRILVVVSSPENMESLDAQEELKALKNALFAVRDRVHIDLLDRATKGRLQQHVSTFRYDIVHYIGHGDFANGTGYLLMEDDARQADRLSVGLLKDIMRNRGIKLAVLNACDTATTAVDAPAFASVAQGLVSAEIPAVIAMQTKIPDYLSQKITGLLYGYLAYGQPLDRVMTELRIGAAVHARSEHQALWGTPVIYMQPPDGRLWADPPQPVPDLVQTLSLEPAAEEETVTIEERLAALKPALTTAAAGLSSFAREEVIDALDSAARAIADDPPQWGRAAYKLTAIGRDFTGEGVDLPADVAAELAEIKTACEDAQAGG